MNNTLDDWAATWRVHPSALADLRVRLVIQANKDSQGSIGSESRVQSAVRLEGAQKGLILWRNNVGALPDARGVPVRYGLANDSKALNENLKSADLIGIRPVVIQPGHVGHTLGQFVSRECKESTWRGVRPGDKREQAQLRWAELVCSLGGDAGFCNGTGTL